MRRVILVAGALGLLAARPEPPDQSALDGAAVAFARAWGRGDADGVAGALAPDGIRLHLGGVGHAMVSGRQARAAVAEFLASRASGRLETRSVSELGGDPPRGSAEYRWQTVVHGTSESVGYTIFVGFTRANGGWRISEIRVF